VPPPSQFVCGIAATRQTSRANVSQHVHLSAPALFPLSLSSSCADIILSNRKSNKNFPRQHEDVVQRSAALSFQPPAVDSSPSVSGVDRAPPVSSSNRLQLVMDAPAIDSQNRRRTRQQISSRSSCTRKASVWTFATTHTFVIFITLFFPPIALAQSCSWSCSTAAPCTGPCHLGTSPFPMLGTTQCCCACLAVKCYAISSFQALQPLANHPPLPDLVCGEMPSRNCKR